MSNDPIRQAQARAAEFNAARPWSFPSNSLRSDTPERIALLELVAAVEELQANAADPASRSRLVLALNAARNALQLGKVLDGIAADPSLAQGHVASDGC